MRLSIPNKVTRQKNYPKPLKGLRNKMIFGDVFSSFGTSALKYKNIKGEEKWHLKHSVLNLPDVHYP